MNLLKTTMSEMKSTLSVIISMFRKKWKSWRITEEEKIRELGNTAIKLSNFNMDKNNNKHEKQGFSEPRNNFCFNTYVIVVKVSRRRQEKYLNK